ncbi:MAG: outer membrane protein transport protein [Acidobacteriota bacterium]|nr:outer membrane protein transport protein [Acidobacteriota bacterium]
MVAQPLTALELSLSNPGARSMAFGGAFVALADDATAAYANPAGLVQLGGRPEVSVEARSWSYRTGYTRGGRAAGEPTGWGIDTEPGVLRGESAADLTGLSFVSFVYPKKRWSLAVFQHQLANYEFGLETQGLFGPRRSDCDVAGTCRGEIQRSSVDFEIISRGVALAVRANDQLSLGIGLSHFNPDFHFLGWDYLPDEGTVESYFSAAAFLPERRLQTVEASKAGDDSGLAAGFLWRFVDRWTLGGVYREGPKLELELAVESGPAHRDLPPGVRQVAPFPLRFHLPDVLGLGLAYRSRNGRWTAGLEWDRVEYSTMLENLPVQLRDDQDRLDDGDEIHLGGEYAFFVSTSVLAVRFGAWLDPDHQFQTDSDEPFDRALTPPGEDEVHVAAGVGVAFEKLQIDLGIDLSESIDTASLSAIYSF